MNFQTSDYVLGLTPAILQAVIAAGMLRRGLHREFPWFFSYTVLEVLRSGSLLILVQRSYAAYFYGYWIAEAISVLLGFAVIYEVLGHILRPYEALWGLGRTLFAGGGVALVTFAVATVAGASPPQKYDQLVASIMVAERSLSFVQCGLLVFLILFSTYFALTWRHYACGIALGLGTFASVQLAATAARSEVGWIGNETYSLVTRVAYGCAVLIWTAYLLRPEPERLAVNRVPQTQVEEWNQALQELWLR